MKNLTSKIFKSTISVLIVVSMLMGMCTTLFAEGNATQSSLSLDSMSPVDKDGDGVINIVTFGASNVNGFGMEGYLPPEVGDFSQKDEYNVYGYKRVPAGSYPDLLVKYFKSLGYEVNIDQLAMSSMRAEEVRFMFDDTYLGDEYTDWRFYDVPGVGDSGSAEDGWFIGAGKLAYAELQGWNDIVESSNHNDDRLNGVSAETAIESLKTVYRNDVKNADLIVWDVGINNFGVYLSGRVVDGSYNESISDIAPEIGEKYEEAKAYVLSLIEEKFGTAMLDLIEDVNAEHILDSLIYCLVSYCVNYDISMEKIYELNSDVTVVNVTIQNLMKGLVATLPDIDLEIPLGDIVATIINAANTYMAVGSPYAKNTLYANVSEDQHVTYFIDQLAEYNGDPTTLDRDMINCWRMYNGSNMLAAFETFKFDENGKLITPNNGVFGLSLELSYHLQLVVIDAIAKYLQVGGNLNVLDFGCLAGGDWGTVESTGMGAINSAVENEVYRFIGHLQNGGTYETYEPIDVKDTFWAELAIANNIDVSLMNTFAAYGVRTFIGNAFYAHPNRQGHQEIADIVIAAIENETTGYEVVIRNVIEIIEEYYDDAYAYAYQYAYDNGYIDAVADAIDALADNLVNLDFSDTQMTEAFREELEAEIDEIVELLDAAHELLYAADELDEEALDALMVLLAEAEEALEGLLYVLEQAGIDTYELVIAPAIEKALYELENTIIPAAKELAKEIAKEAHAYLVEALGDAYAQLKTIIADAAKKYLPELADAIYDYLYNNPEEVIDFIATYGPYALEVMEEYGEEALAVLGYVLYFYGEDIAAFIIENHETILANMIAWMEVHGENTAKLIQVYAEALGLCDAVREQIAELEALLEEIKAAYEEAEAKEMLDEIIAQIEAQIAILEAKIEELKAELAEVIADVKELIAEGKEIVAQKVAELKAAVAELKAEVEAAIEELKAEAEAVIAEVVAQLEAILEDEINNLEDLVNAVEAKVTEAVDTIIILVEEIIYYATHGVYIIEDESYYLALGDSTAVGDSYVEMLVEYLDMVDEYNNLAIDDITAEELLALMTDEYMISEILRADLITLSMSNNTFTVFAANQIAAYLTGRPTVDLIWENYLPEEAIDVLNEKLSEIYLSFLEAGLDEKMAFVATYAIENFLYAYASYMFSYVAIVATIHEINPDALVVLVGMSNTFDGIVMDLDGSDLAIGEYVEYLVAVANIESFALAVAGENTIYVDAPDVETDFDAEEVDFLGFITEIVLYGAETLYPNAAGQEYIFGQIVESLEVYDNRGLLGDADGNGIVDMFDASLILQYYTQEIKEEDIYLFVSDVDGNGEVDMFDASLVLQYYTGEIDVFPVEE